jgi:predicted Rossmann-fold nucleotide-binding protein
MGGGAGTLSEMAFAWVYKRLIIAYNVDGWSGKLAGERIDHRKRIDWEGDKVFKVENENEVVETIQKYLKHYSERHNGIISKMKKDDEI